MRLFSHTLELRAIRTLTSLKSQKAAAKLFAGMRDGCFHTNAAKESYARIKSMLQQRGELLSWNELIVDPVISESVRRKLVQRKVSAIPTEKIDHTIRLLHKYRKAREAVKLAEYIIETVSKERVDVDLLYDNISERTVKARIAGDNSNWFVHIGGDDKKDIDVVKQALSPETKRFIPTGFKAFDRQNRGLPRGREFLLASNSGGGKSLLARQLAENIACQGGRVCIVPLEMDDVEMMQRNLASMSQKSMSKIIDPQQFSRKQRDEILVDYLRYRRRIKKAGGLLSLFTPQEDMTAEEILFALKPFGYDMIIIDYIGLLKGVDGDDQWKALQKVTRFGARFAVLNNISVGFCCQLTEEGLLAASKGMNRDASNFWRWTAGAREKETGFITIDQLKARQKKAFPFTMFVDWERMTVRDLSDDEKTQRDEERRERKEKRGAYGKPGHNSRGAGQEAPRSRRFGHGVKEDKGDKRKTKADTYFDIE